jgi:surface carbohydrate biosynthesis protein
MTATFVKQLWCLVIRAIEAIKTITDKNTSFKIGGPNQSRILVLDSIDDERLGPAVFDGLDYVSCDLRSRHKSKKFRVYLSLKLFYEAIKKAYMAGSLGYSYIYATVKCISPKIVVGSVPMPLMLPLAHEFKSITFFTILNGYWFEVLDEEVISSNYVCSLLEAFNMSPGMKLSNFHIFCFGMRDVDIFRQHGLGEEITGIKYHAIGSLFSDYMRSLMVAECYQKSNDLCFISQCDYETITGSERICELLVINTRTVVGNLNRYLLENDMGCVVLLRSHPAYHDVEIEFYKSIFDAGLRISYHLNDEPFAVYKGIAKYEVIVTLYSSVGYEAMTWGKKVIFCLYGFSKIFRFSPGKYSSNADMLRWYIENPAYSVFKDNLDAIIGMSCCEYMPDDCLFDYIMSVNNEKPAHRLFRDMVLRYCDTSVSRG